MDPVTDHQTLVARLLGGQRRRDTLLLRITGGSLVVALVSLLTVLVLVLRPTPMHYTGPQGPGIAQPGIMDDDYVLDFAQRVVEVRYTFQPTTLEARCAQVRPWLHPRLSVMYDAQCTRDLKKVRPAKMSAETVVLTRTVSKREGQSVLVHLEARRGVSLGERRNPDEPFKADLVLLPFPEGGQAGKVVVYSIVTSPELSLGDPS